MEPVNDLDRAGEILGSQVPGPWCAVTEHDTALGTVKASSLGFALDPLGKLGRGLAGITGGDALDGSGVAHRSGVTYWCTLLILSPGAPHRDQLDLPRLRRAIGLLALSSLQFGCTHRHAGTV